MSRFKLTIEYDGTQYHGWQVLHDKPTIQGCLLDACRKVFNTNTFELYGGGRTDAGVHALGQTAHLDIAATIYADALIRRINEHLPDDINLIHAEKVQPSFHARHSATARSYVYHISLRRTGLHKRYVWWVKDQLDIEMMQKAASLYIGSKDFRSFCAKPDENETTVVNILHAAVQQRADMILFHVVGTHFLWKMVRRMTGVLVQAARGNISLAQIEKMFLHQSDIPSHNTAPPSGLFLERIYYANETIDTNIRSAVNV